MAGYIEDFAAEAAIAALVDAGLISELALAEAERTAAAGGAGSGRSHRRNQHGGGGISGITATRPSGHGRPCSLRITDSGQTSRKPSCETPATEDPVRASGKSAPKLNRPESVSALAARTIHGTFAVWTVSRRYAAVLPYAIRSQPVRWLLELNKQDRKIIGEDIKLVQFR
ncbi:MAG: hypothetical protein R2851_04275 [Caldilineaceae bacterium]